MSKRRMDGIENSLLAVKLKNKEKFDQTNHNSYGYSLVVDPSLFNLLEYIWTWLVEIRQSQTYNLRAHK